MVSFNAILPITLIVSICFSFSIIFIWLEWRRKKSLLILRIAAACLMILALAGILLRPSYPIEKSSPFILLTPGYDQKKVDSLIQTQGNLTLLHTSNAPSYKGSKLLPYSNLQNFENEIRFVVGEGLPMYALDLMDRKVFQFISSKGKEGITQFRFDDIILRNRKNKLHAVYHNTSGKTRITLKGPVGKEDSVVIETKGDQYFNLSFTPKQSGNLSYQFSIEKENGDALTETLPLHVNEPKPIRILFLQSYPTFETQYLKNFLSSKGHQLLLRYQLSKNNFRYEYANLHAQSSNRITNELLNRFDLVIADGEELKTLSYSEQEILNESIQSGLGLLQLNIDPPKETKKGIHFFSFQVQKTKVDTTSIILSGSREVTLPALPYRATESSSLKSIIKNKSGVLSGYQYRGSGKIGFQFLQQTYQLTLSGDSLSYADLWSPLIEQVSRYNISLSKIKIKNLFPIYQDEPIDIEIISSNQNPNLIADSIQTPLVEDVLIDDVLSARVWASVPGWHTLQLKGETSLDYYVSKSNDWKSLAGAQQMIANKRMASQTKIRSTKNTFESQTINPAYFYLLFVLTAGILWLAPKL